MNLAELEKTDEHVFGEIFKDNHYNVNRDDIAGKRILDVGANVGMFSILALEHGAKSLVAVEASGITFKHLQRNTSTYSESYRDITLLHKAAFDSSRKHINIVTAEALGCSKVNIDNMGEPIETITLSGLLDYFPINDNDLVLKIDIEGAEQQFVLSSSRDSLRRFNTIFIEIHELFPGSKQRINDFILANGFVIDQAKFGWCRNQVGEVLPWHDIVKYRRADDR